LLSLAELVGYDWISPEMSEKVALKDEHFDRLYLYPRAAPPIALDHLGRAVYPLITFFGRVLEVQSQKVLLPQLGDDAVDALGRCLAAVAEGPFLSDEDVKELIGRSRESVQVVSGMWPRVNLAAPDLPDLLERSIAAVLERVEPDTEEWRQWIGVGPERLSDAIQAVNRVMRAAD